MPLAHPTQASLRLRHPGGSALLTALTLTALAGGAAVAGSAVPAEPTPATAVGTPLSVTGFTPPGRAIAPAGATAIHNHGDPTPQEQLMLELVNRARANPVAEAARFAIDLNTNLPPGTITPDPKPPLAFHPLLIASARVHSDWMLLNDVFAHEGEAGNNPGDRMEAAGYPFSGGWAWGENIAWQGTTGTANLTAFTVAEHEGLFRSAGHRENLLDPGFDEIGIGVRSGVFTVISQMGTPVNYNAVMAAQNFARSGGTPGPLVLGVVYRDTNGDKFYTVGEGLGGVTVTPSAGEGYAVTSASGGFAFPTTQTGGTILVTVTGPGVTTPITKAVPLATTNSKVDFEVLGDIPLAFTPGKAGFDAQKRFQLELTGPAGARAQVKYSADLQTWQNLGTYTLNSGKAPVTDTTGKPGQRFYRAYLMP